MPTTRKLRKLWRGNRLKALRALQKALLRVSYQDMVANDYFEFHVGASLPVLFDDTLDSSITAAMQTLSDRIDRALAEKY